VLFRSGPDAREKIVAVNGPGVSGAVVVAFSVDVATRAKSPCPACTPACPLCLTLMVKRTARREANAGGEFLGMHGLSGVQMEQGLLRMNASSRQSQQTAHAAIAS
jgi:hypothetical protein